MSHKNIAGMGLSTVVSAGFFQCVVSLRYSASYKPKQKSAKLFRSLINCVVMF